MVEEEGRAGNGERDSYLTSLPPCSIPSSRFTLTASCASSWGKIDQQRTTAVETTCRQESAEWKPPG